MSGRKSFPTKEIWQRLDSSAAWDGDWFAFMSEDQSRFIRDLKAKATIDVRIDKLADSFEGRPLELFRFGSGKRRVLIWARQHGNEPECTAALCTALHELLTKSDDPTYKTILQNCELLVLPMVNPDGNDAFTRQCATGIDLNREAQALSMVEAQQLVRLKDEYKPEFSFNLHDMAPRKSREGEDAGLISIAFQAGPIDIKNSDNDARLRAKTIIGHMYQTVQEVTPKESICRYKAYYMNRGFGDSMNRWGVPCVLIESGSWYSKEGGDEYVIRLHALALLSGLFHFAQRQDEPFNGDLYEEIPFEVATYEFDGLFRETRILDSKTATVFRGDLGWQKHLFDDRVAPNRQYPSRIQQAGDISEENGVDQRRLPGRVIVPGVVAVAPDLLHDDQQIARELTEPLVRAGITTVAVACGPFATPDAAEQYIAECLRRRPPINVVAYERLEALEEIVQRAALTPFAGFVVSNLAIAPHQLLTLLHRFIPEIQADIRDVHENSTLGLDLYFTTAGSPNDTRILLNLRALQDTAAQNAYDFEPSLLENIIQTYLRRPSQIHYCWTGDDWMPDFLPAETAPAGIADRAPSPNFIAHRVSHLPEALEKSSAHLLKFMTHGMAEALRLPGVGAVRYGHRADFSVLPEAILKGKHIEQLAPEIIVLNGEVAFDSQDLATPAFHGMWTFAH